MHRSAILAISAALTLVGLFLAIFPGIDLWASQLFFADGRFIGITPLGEMLREFGHGLPFVIMACAFGAYGLAKFGWKRIPAPGGRAVIFMATTLAFGPGLVVNVTLKDNSHRPRPVQTQEFGGPWEFKPWYRFDGQCIRNCSFVSGEASSAFWTLAPALLTPPAVRPAAVIGAMVFGTGVATLRMAFGGHYLSDSLISAFLTILIVMLAHRAFFGRVKKTDAGLRGSGAPL